MRRSRMMPANASHTGSSSVRGKGLLCAVNGTEFLDELETELPNSLSPLPAS
jgi:hypothetical protein